MSSGTLLATESETAVRPSRVRIEKREQHLDIEGRFKDIASIYWCLALVWVIAGAAMSVELTGDGWAILLFKVGVPALLTLIGFGVFTFQAWARPFAYLACLLLVVTPPRGFLRGLQGLRDLASAQGRTLFSKPYRDLLRKTRHLKSSMSALPIAILGFFSVMLVYVVLT